MKRWILAGCGWLAFTLVLVIAYDPATLTALESAMLMAIFLTATFSVNFAIAGYNASLYRQFHQGLAPRLVFASVGVLSLAFWPSRRWCLCRHGSSR